ncbi:hypothetical protein BaRGS_00025154 [Batillaria attramentaria]|uniref:Uncharacterized protein n=1 Tax=Batillaria attramentaria TaxID=370345 RepID=A0ABD0K931_9CAEN
MVSPTLKQPRQASISTKCQTNSTPEVITRDGGEIELLPGVFVYDGTSEWELGVWLIELRATANQISPVSVCFVPGRSSPWCLIHVLRPRVSSDDRFFVFKLRRRNDLYVDGSGSRPDALIKFVVWIVWNSSPDVARLFCFKGNLLLASGFPCLGLPIGITLVLRMFG